jgi:GntR family transcriptional regulator
MPKPRKKGVSAGHLPHFETRRLAQRVKEALLRSILSGAFPDLLPSEERLAEQLGVSRTTVREALRSLEEEGLVTRQRGIGTWVNYHVVRATSLNRAIGFFDLIREAGYEPRIEYTVISEVSATPEVSLRLALPDTGQERILAVGRLFLADGQPVIELTENVPLSELKRPLDEGDFPDSIFAFADSYCRSPIDHTVVEIIPVVAGREIAERLQLRRSEPLLRLIETHHASDGRPFIVSVIHSVDRLLRFTVVRKRM